MRINDTSGMREVNLKTGSPLFSDGVPWHEVGNIEETEVSYLMTEPKKAVFAVSNGQVAALSPPIALYPQPDALGAR